MSWEKVTVKVKNQSVEVYHSAKTSEIAFHGSAPKEKDSITLNNKVVEVVSVNDIANRGECFTVLYKEVVKNGNPKQSEG